MNKKGFTLIEIMVVITIIAILAVTSFSTYEGTKASARDGRRKADLETLRGAFELYYADAKEYPTALPDCNQPLTYNSSTYLEKTPCDPANPTTQKYEINSNGVTYTMGAKLEREDNTVCLAQSCTATQQCDYCVNNP